MSGLAGTDPLINPTLPSHHVIAQNVPQGWEEAVLWTWENGAEIETEYDKPDSPPSRDADMTLIITDAFSEPRIHKAFPGGMRDLESYRQEVVDGIHDHWIGPDKGMWQYTYHERLFAYKVPGIEEPIDQIGAIVNALVKSPHTRRAQATTWQPWNDLGISDPACLQRLWCRIFDDELVMSVDIRSNDAFKAALMNILAFTELQRYIAERVSEGLGCIIRPGQYVHHANSWHIYGDDFPEFKRFLDSVEKRAWEDRTMDSSSPDVKQMFKEARAEVALSLEIERKTGKKGLYEWPAGSKPE